MSDGPGLVVQPVVFLLFLSVQSLKSCSTNLYFHPISIMSRSFGVSHLSSASRFDRKARDMQQKYELRMKTIREEMDAWIKPGVGSVHDQWQITRSSPTCVDSQRLLL